MKPWSWFRRAAIATALAAATVALFLLQGSAPSRRTVAPIKPTSASLRSDYLALGDSYSAGNGTTHAEGDCQRSTDAYPHLYKEDLGPGWNLVHRACEGSSTATVIKQVADATPATRLVTLTAGGNDGKGFLAVLAACVVNPSNVLCKEVVATEKKYVSTYLPGRLAKMYTAIGEAAPGAQVIHLGYPIPYDEKTTCRNGRSVTAQKWVNSYARALNAAISKAAAKADVAWAPVDFSGHELCTDKPWLVGFSKNIRGSFHPNDDGHAHGYLAALTKNSGW